MLKRLQRPRVILLLILSALSFLPLLGRRDIATSHEARVGLVARQMAVSGWPWSARPIDVPQVRLAHTAQGERLISDPTRQPLSVNPWLVPVMTGQIRMQKPPLPYWCGAICDRLLGDNETSLRLVPALLGAAATLLVCNWARMLIGSIGAWYAGFVWISSYFIVDEYRKAMADPYLAFVTLLALWAWTRATVRERQRIWLLVCYFAVGLGILAKGPIVLLYVPILIAAFHACYRHRLPGRPIDHLLGVALLLCVALPWPLWILLHVPHALEFWRYESVGSFSDNVEKARPWYYYLPNLFVISLPWTPLWILGLAVSALRPWRRRRWFAALATIVVLFVFSLSHVKKNAYLLPLMPVQTLVVAEALVRLTAWTRAWRANRPVHLPMRRFAVLAVALAIAVQIFVNGWMTSRSNRNSAVHVAQEVAVLLDTDPSLSLLTSNIPEDAAYYIPFDLLKRPGTGRRIAIVDDRAGDRQANLSAQCGDFDVAEIEKIDLSRDSSDRWHAYWVTLRDNGVSRPTRQHSE